MLEACMQTVQGSKPPLLLQVTVLQFRRNKGYALFQSHRGALLDSAKTRNAPPFLRNWRNVAAQQLEEGRFAGTIVAADRPMLTSLQTPRDVAQNGRPVQRHVD